MDVDGLDNALALIDDAVESVAGIGLEYKTSPARPSHIVTPSISHLDDPDADMFSEEADDV